MRAENYEEFCSIHRALLNWNERIKQKGFRFTMLSTRIVGIILSIVALLMWMFSISEARLCLESGQGIGDLGLISILPGIFLVSISLLTLSFLITLRISKEDRVLLFCEVILLVVMLTLTPTLIENTARYGTTYWNYRTVDCILQEKFINPVAVWIHNWPGFSIAYSVFMQVTSLPEQALLSLYPMFFGVILIFPLYIFFHLVFEDQKRSKWIAIWIFYVANWIGQDYFSPQSFGLFILTLFAFVVFRLMNSSVPHVRNWVVISLLLFLPLVFSHLLTSLAILSVILVFFVLNYFRKSIFVALLAVLLISWTIHGASTYLEWNLLKFIQETFHFELILQANVQARISGNLAHVIVTLCRVIFSALIAMFAFSGIVLTWRSGKMEDVGKKVFSMLLGASLLLNFFVYGGELFMRIFLFCLVPMAYFISRGSNWKAFFCLIAIFLVVVVPSLHMIAHYGNEELDYVPSSEIQGAEFFYEATTKGYTVTMGFRDFGYHRSYRDFSLADTMWRNGKLTGGFIEEVHPDWPTFVIVNYGTKKYYDFILGEPKFVSEMGQNLTESPHYNQIYSNPSCDVYFES